MTCEKCGRGTLDDFGGKFTAVHLAAPRDERTPNMALALERDGDEIRMSIIAPGIRIEIPIDRHAVSTLARMFADVVSELRIWHAPPPAGGSEPQGGGR